MSCIFISQFLDFCLTDVFILREKFFTNHLLNFVLELKLTHLIHLVYFSTLANIIFMHSNSVAKLVKIFSCKVILLYDMPKGCRVRAGIFPIM